jgi:hypothetical protein
VEEEDIVDELNRESFAYTRTKGMNDTCSHEATIGFSLRSTEKAKHKLQRSVNYKNVREGKPYHKQRQQQYRTSAKLQVCRNKQQRTKSKNQVRIGHKS